MNIYFGGRLQGVVPKKTNPRELKEWPPLPLLGLGGLVDLRLKKVRRLVGD